MWPTIVEVQTAVGPQPVNTYGLFMVLAFSGAFLLIHTLTKRYAVVGRAGKGFEMIKRDRFVRVVPKDVELYELK